MSKIAPIRFPRHKNRKFSKYNLTLSNSSRYESFLHFHLLCFVVMCPWVLLDLNIFTLTCSNPEGSKIFFVFHYLIKVFWATQLQISRSAQNFTFLDLSVSVRHEYRIGAQGIIYILISKDLQSFLKCWPLPFKVIVFPCSLSGVWHLSNEAKTSIYPQMRLGI